MSFIASELVQCSRQNVAVKRFGIAPDILYLAKSFVTDTSSAQLFLERKWTLAYRSPQQHLRRKHGGICGSVSNYRSFENELVYKPRGCRAFSRIDDKMIRDVKSLGLAWEGSLQ